MTDDLISRQQAIMAIEQHRIAVLEGHKWDEGIEYGYAAAHRHLVDIIEQLPFAQPEQRWIPCSERLPEEREWIGTKRFGTTISDEVYVTFEAPDGQRFTDHISFQNGKLSRSDEHRMRVVYKGAKPIAWMPLPEPWKGEEDEAD